jgi:hypothetical protein
MHWKQFTWLALEILVETETMDPKVAQSALNGNHYSRGIEALSLLSEVMFSLLWEELIDNVSR